MSAKLYGIVFFADQTLYQSLGQQTVLVAFDIFYVVVIPLVYENRNEKNAYQNDNYEISGWEATVNEDNLVVDDAEVVQIFTYIW